MIILTKANRNNRIIRYSFTDYLKIIHLVNNYNNFIVDKYDFYYEHEYKKFKDYYIRYHYGYNGLFIIEYYNYSGKIHREDGPAWISYYYDGEINYKKYHLNGNVYSYEDYLLEIEKLV